MANKEAEKQPGTDDAVVLMFLTLVEEDGIEVDVTLNVRGAIISGTLIGPTAYYEGITESSKHLHDDTMSKIISKKFADLKDAYSQQKQQNQGEGKKEEKESTPPSYIHLKNAKYLNVNGQMTANSSGNWWRGKLESLDGISFNSLH